MKPVGFFLSHAIKKSQYGKFALPLEEKSTRRNLFALLSSSSKRELAIKREREKSTYGKQAERMSERVYGKVFLTQNCDCLVLPMLLRIFWRR